MQRQAQNEAAHSIVNYISIIPAQEKVTSDKAMFTMATTE